MAYLNFDPLANIFIFFLGISLCSRLNKNLPKIYPVRSVKIQLVFYLEKNYADIVIKDLEMRSSGTDWINLKNPMTDVLIRGEKIHRKDDMRMGTEFGMTYV